MSKSTEWKGDGQPPVGTLCHCPDLRRDVVILHWEDNGHGAPVAAVKAADNSELVWHSEFTPIGRLVSTNDQNRESVIDDIAIMIGRGTFIEDATGIYDAGFRKLGPCAAEHQVSRLVSQNAALIELLRRVDDEMGSNMSLSQVFYIRNVIEDGIAAAAEIWRSRS